MRNNKNLDCPCYKVVKSDGSLGGYFGELNSKKKIDLLKKDGIKLKNGKINDKFIWRFNK